MIEKIIWDVNEFMVVMIVIMLMFANVLYFRNIGPKKADLYLDDGADDPFTPRPTAFQTVFLLGFVGDFDRGSYPSTADQILLDCFVVVINIVMLNLLIAIVSESFDSAMSDAFTLYWSARYDIVREEIDTFGYCFLERWVLNEAQVLKIVEDQIVTGDHANDKQQGKIADIENRVRKNTNAEIGRLERKIIALQDSLDEMRLEKEQSSNAKIEELHRKFDNMQEVLLETISASAKSGSPQPQAPPFSLRPLEVPKPMNGLLPKIGI